MRQTCEVPPLKREEGIGCPLAMSHRLEQLGSVSTIERSFPMLLQEQREALRQHLLQFLLVLYRGQAGEILTHEGGWSLLRSLLCQKGEPTFFQRLLGIQEAEDSIGKVGLMDFLQQGQGSCFLLRTDDSDLFRVEEQRET